MNRAPARIGIVLAALALLVRLVVPAGFMPLATSTGAPTLVICTGQGPMAMPMQVPMASGMHMPGMEHAQDPPGHAGGHDTDGANHGCFLAAVGGAIDLAAPPVSLPQVFVVAVERIVPALVVRPGLGLAAPPPPKTGPPSFR